VKSGNDALAYAKQLPEPEGSVEAIQIHLNMATAYLQLKKIMEAKIHSNLCVELAERGIAMRQGNPQVYVYIHIFIYVCINIYIYIYIYIYTYI
jgi:hypothetical protein